MTRLADVWHGRWIATIRVLARGSIDTIVLPGPPSCVYSLGTLGAAAHPGCSRADGERARRSGTTINVNFLFITHGTDGDVHPFIGLGIALKNRGHRVTLITNEHFEGLAARNDLAFIANGTTEQYRKAFEDPDVWKSVAGARILGRWMCDSMPAQYEAVIKHVEPGETVIVASGAAVGARIAHETLRVPMASIVLQPAVIRSLHRTPVVAGVPSLPTWLPPGAKRPFLWVFDRIADRFFCIAEVNAFRASLGLRPVKSLVKEWWLSPQRVIALFPDWYGMPQPDWPQQIRMTGFPLFDEPTKDNALPGDAKQFLDDGDPPIVFTPGTGMMHGRAFFEAAVEACRLLGRRGLLLTRHTGQLPPTLPNSVRHLAYVPFGQLLTRAAAIVHHGGVGTLAQAMAAGIPQLIMPMAYDQPDNADRLRRLGVGDTLKRRAFRGPAVARKLDRLLTSPAVAESCRAIARRLDGSRAVEQTCDLLEELANGSPGAKPLASSATSNPMNG